MKIRLLLMLALLLGQAGQGAWAQSVSASAASRALPPRMVMTWVAPYAITASQQRLRAFYGASGPRNSLTHLGLQFWTVTPDGNLTRVTKYGAITNAQINGFVGWARQNRIKVMLTVYNGVEGWDWPLARNAFNPPNRGRFINQLVAEMRAMKLDGIDLDLEGVGDFEADKASYIAFVRQLSARVRALKKQITVDSFHYIWNAPNQNWWAAIFPLVDGITSMGYEDLGRNAPDWQSYAAQKAKAGKWSRKLLIGVPSHLPDWQGSTALAQAQWFNSPAAGRTGVGIWDAQFSAAPWAAAPLWNQLKAVRQDKN